MSIKNKSVSTFLSQLVKRKSGEEFISEGFGINRRNVMHNFSVIIGPKDDPARIEGRDPIGALKK